MYTEFAFTVKRIYRFLGLARIQKSHFNYTHCSTYICVYTEKRTNDPWKKEHPSKKIFERYRMHGFRNTTFSYFFSIYRAEEDIEKRWKDIKMTNKLTDFSIWSLYISFLEISKHDEFILLHRREWERERERFKRIKLGTQTKKMAVNREKEGGERDFRMTACRIGRKSAWISLFNPLSNCFARSLHFGPLLYPSLSTRARRP